MDPSSSPDGRGAMDRGPRTTGGHDRSEVDVTFLADSLQGLPGAVLITDPDQRIVFVNAEFERLTGYDRASALGRNPRFLQGPQTDGRVTRRGRWAPSRSAR